VRGRRLPPLLHPAQPLTVAEYDESMRQRCADDRDLVARSGFTAPCSVPQHLVFTTPDGRVHVTTMSEDAAVTVPLPAGTVIDKPHHRHAPTCPDTQEVHWFEPKDPTGMASLSPNASWRPSKSRVSDRGCARTARQRDGGT
jgi:hypothetical protein